MDRVICYADGLNIYYGLRKGHFRNYLWLDLKQLSELLLMGREQLTKVKYFTSPMKADAAKEARQSTFIDALSSEPMISVFKGKIKEFDDYCRACKEPYVMRREKETDTGLSVEIVRDAFRDEFDSALLMSGDTDFVPPLRVVSEEFPEKKIIVAKPINCGPCVDLRAYANRFVRVKTKHLSVCQFPDEVTTSEGYIVKRPDTFKWPMEE